MTSYSGIEKIVIKATCTVAFKKSSGNTVSVSVDGTKKDDVKISKSGDTLNVEYVSAGSGGTTIISGGGSVISIGGGDSDIVIGDIMQTNSNCGQNVSIINGVVYINGKQVKPEGSTEPDIIPVRILIELPDGLNLESEFTGMAKVAGNVVFNSARINSKGATDVALFAKSARASVSGSGDIDLKISGGSLRLNLSGSAGVSASGTFSDVDVSVSGSADITTSGPVSGDYDAQVSGSGSIRHSGSIAGSKNKSVSGSGRISL